MTDQEIEARWQMWQRAKNFSALIKKAALADELARLVVNVGLNPLIADRDNVEAVRLARQILALSAADEPADSGTQCFSGDGSPYFSKWPEPPAPKTEGPTDG